MYVAPRHFASARRDVVEETGGAQVSDAGEVAAILQSEVDEKRRCRREFERAARRLATSGRSDPAGREQNIERPRRHRDTANILDLGTRRGGVIGDDRQRLDRRAAQLAWELARRGEQVAEVGGGPRSTRLMPRGA